MWVGITRFEVVETSKSDKWQPSAKRIKYEHVDLHVIDRKGRA